MGGGGWMIGRYLNAKLKEVGGGGTGGKGESEEGRWGRRGRGVKF